MNGFEDLGSSLLRYGYLQFFLGRTFPALDLRLIFNFSMYV